MKPAPITKLEYTLLAAVMLWAAVLREVELDRPLFWVDEAESTINALTILDHGYPVDHYLGIPIFENTLTRPWPESAEYEFKDSSYSDKGVAIYHGWLPLYAIAGSLKAFGVVPDPAPPDPREHVPAVRHDDRDIRRITVAARAPAVVFGMIFLILLFVTGREMGGRGVGWAALLVAALGERTIDISREARYYSATILLGLACCLMIWRMLHRGRWRDFVIGGVVFALLFFTHTVSFLVAGVAFALASIPQLRKPAFIGKASVCGAIIVAAAAPWAVMSGFLAQTSEIPKAWPHLKFPDDYLLFPFDRPPTLILFGAGFTALLLADLLRGRLPARFVEPFAGRRGVLYFLGMWVVLGYLAFVFVMPAASFVAKRMTLPMLGPGILLAALIFSALAQMAVGRPSRLVTFATPALFLGFMVLVRGLTPLPTDRATNTSHNMQYVIDWLRDRTFNPGTRFYATPNKHLVLSVYTGIPVQAVAPVRKQFLDEYDRDIVIVEAELLYQPPGVQPVLAAAAGAGQLITDQRALELSWGVTYKAIVETTAKHFIDIDPRPETVPLPPYLRPLLEEQPDFTASWVSEHFNPIVHCPAMFRGFELRDYVRWWPVYFYRFVNPLDRLGPKLNYLARAQRGKVWVLPVGWRVYRSPPPAASALPDIASTAPAPETDAP